MLGLAPVQHLLTAHICVSGLQAEASAVRNVIPVRLYATIPGIEMPSTQPLHVLGPVFAVAAIPLERCVVNYFLVANFLAWLRGCRPRDPGAADDGGPARAAGRPRGRAGARGD